jgi:dihydrofolate synthase/folylpolyglutamate synthase
MNAALAIAMLRHQDALRVQATSLSTAMGLADWPARLQHLAQGPLTGDLEVWLDGGHNPSAAQQIASHARHHWADGKPLSLVFACLSTKDPAGMLEPFEDIVEHVHCVPIPDHSCFAPDDLVEIAAGLGFTADAHNNVEQALGSVPSKARVLIFGSLYLAGAVLAANDQIPA